MNLIILSSIPGYVLAMIIIEAIIMMGLGGFLIVDIIRSRIKAIKKEKEEEEARKREAAQKSISLDNPEENYSNLGLSELEYLRRMNKEQKEYIELLEKRISLRRDLDSLEAKPEEEYEEVVEEENPNAIEEDTSFDEFWNSIPVKEGVTLDEGEPTGEDTVLSFDEPMDEDLGVSEEETTEEYEHNKNVVIPIPREGVVITASSLKGNTIDPDEKRRQQEKIQAFLKEQGELEESPKVEEEKEDIQYDIVEPWYCLAKPFVKKKKKYNNF